MNYGPLLFYVTSKVFQFQRAEALRQGPFQQGALWMTDLGRQYVRSPSVDPSQSLGDPSPGADPGFTKWGSKSAVAAPGIEVWGCSPSPPFPSPSFPSHPVSCPVPPIPSVTFPHHCSIPSLLFPSIPVPLPATERPINSFQLGVWGSAVSSPSGVWGRAPAEIEFGTC